MKISPRATLLAGLLLAQCALGGCGSGSSGSVATGGGGGGGTTPTPPPGTVPTPPASFTVPSFGGPQVATLLMRNVPGGNETGSQLNVSASASNKVVATGSRSIQPRADAGVGTPGLRDLPPEALAAELKAVERVAQRSTPPGDIRPRFSQLPEGATTTFFISVSGQTVTCQKMNSENETVHCTILAQVVNGQPVVSKSTALALAQAFDTNNPFQTGSGIYDQVRGVFGSEWITSPTGGRDGDTKVALVLVNSQAMGNADLFGFFRPSDEFSKSEISSSNEGEILYLNSDKATGDMFDLLSTATHEFQHLIDFNVKFGRNGAFNGQNENVTINEGKSCLAEDLFGYGLNATGGGSQFLFAISDNYLRATSTQPFFIFGSSNGDYGKGYLMMRFINDRFGTNAIRSIATSTGVGLVNIEQQLGVSFRSLFDQWTLANLCSGLAGAPIQFTYANGFSTTGTFSVRGLGTRSLPGVVPQTVANPPAGTASGAIQAWTAYYAEYSNGTGQNLVLTLTQTPNTDANLVLQSTRGSFAQNQ